MPFLCLNGINTHFHHIEREGKTPTAIFIHGAGQSSLCWKNQHTISEYVSRYDFIFLDLPGHGKSEGTGFKSIGEYSDFINNFIKELGIEEYVLIGHSMGGRISQVLAVKHPDGLIGCVLAGTGARIRVTRHTMETARERFEEFAEMASENSFSVNTPRSVRQEFKKWLLDTKHQTLINDLEACNNLDMRDEVSEIDVPTLIIAGQKDILATPKRYLHLKNQIKNSKLEVIQDSGHFMMLEKPELFNKLITDFLNFL